MICAICGHECVSPSIEHFYPKAINKWLESIISRQDYLKLKSVIESKNNIIATHIKCNYKKADSIIDFVFQLFFC